MVRKLGNLRSALRSIESGLEVDPEEKNFKKEKKNLEKRIKTLKDKFLKEMEKFEVGKNEIFKKIRVDDFRVKGVVEENEQPVVVEKKRQPKKANIDVEKVIKSQNEGPQISEFLRLKDIDSSIVKKDNGRVSTKQIEDENMQKNDKKKSAKKVRFTITYESEFQDTKPKRRLRKKRPKKGLKPSKSILKKSKISLKNTNEKNLGKVKIEIIRDEQEESLKKAMKKLIGGYLKSVNEIKNKTQFLQVWRSFKDDEEARKFILMEIELENFQKIFGKFGIESDDLDEFLHILMQIDNSKRKIGFLKILSKVEGMDLNIMMMSRKDKAKLKGMINGLEGDFDDKKDYLKILSDFELS